MCTSKELLILNYDPWCWLFPQVVGRTTVVLSGVLSRYSRVQRNCLLGGFSLSSEEVFSAAPPLTSADLALLVDQNWVHALSSH